MPFSYYDRFDSIVCMMVATRFVAAWGPIAADQRAEGADMIDDLKINEAAESALVRQGYWSHDTIADIWQRAAVAHPDREYVCDDTGSRLTYGEVDDKAGRVAAWLVAEGVEAGDVVTLQFPTWARVYHRLCGRAESRRRGARCRATTTT